MRRRWWLAIGAWPRRGRRRRARTRAHGERRPGQLESKQLSHEDFARLFAETRVGDEKDAVLGRWPIDPYQHYRDNLEDDCYEWSDTPLYLYNLCFTEGVLRTKESSGERSRLDGATTNERHGKGGCWRFGFDSRSLRARCRAGAPLLGRVPRRARDDRAWPYVGRLLHHGRQEDHDRSSIGSGANDSGGQLI